MFKKTVSAAMLLLLAVGALVAASTIQQASADGVDWWPMFHHDLNHTGTSTSTGPTTNNSLWTYATGRYVGSSPAVFGGLVYVGSDDDNVYCFNATSGAFVWNYTTGDYVYSSPAVFSAESIFGGKVTIYTWLYVGCNDGKVYCLNAADGAFVWSYKTGDSVYSSPTDNPLVYVGSLDGNVYCLDEETGARVWAYTTGSEVDSSPAVVDGLVYVGSLDDMVYCLNATSGAFVWSYKTVDSVESSPAVFGGLVYVGSDDHNVYCLNASTGAFVWSYKTGSEVGYSSPAVVDGLVYVGSLDDMVYCLNATSGAFVWSYRTGGMVFSSPAVVTGLVYVGSNDDNVYCLNASTGAFVWSYTTGGEVDSSPAVVNGVVYVGSEDGKVYAFGPSSAEHDVSIEGIIASKSVLGSGYSMGINVTAADLGSYTETLNLTAYANATIIGSENITLAAGISTTVTFTWNTTGLAYGNYTLSAYALLVLGETNTGNANMTGGTVYVGIPGDINGDGIVDIYDGVIIAGAFNSQSGDHNWNPNADINGDGIVDIFDAVILAGNFNQRIP